jgi:hypothetical protein
VSQLGSQKWRWALSTAPLNKPTGNPFKWGLHNVDTLMVSYDEWLAVLFWYVTAEDPHTFALHWDRNYGGLSPFIHSFFIHIPLIHKRSHMRPWDIEWYGMVLKSQLTNGVGFARFVTANEGLNGNSSHILQRSECGHRWKILVSVTLQEQCTS